MNASFDAMNQGWYVIRAKPQSEQLAASALERNGFDLFFPRVRTLDAKQRQFSVPLFPGYLFIRNRGESPDWPSIRRLPGVLGWVHFNGVAPLVPDDVITDLARRVESIDMNGGLWTRFQPGDKVRVISGNVETLAEVIEEPQSPQARVRVLLEFMGRRVSAQVPAHDLQLAQHNTSDKEQTRGPRRTRGKGRWIRGFSPNAAASA
ncbi:MAG: hypothetical protein IIC84_03045 [Chloroflexi bacterium]|nr:hypothetical protein [Chloroflexota bacterium]